MPVNVAPAVSLTSPANSATFTAPASITLAADATDSDCTVAKVEFYTGSTLITTLTSAPYSFTWTNVAAGNYTLTARAIDNQGATSISAPVSISVTVPVNAAPSVSVTSPANGTTFSAPADIPLAANAADTDGTIAKVEFYTGSTLITTLTAPPYSVLWTGVPVGSYTLTAKATDNQGATTTSAPVTVTVNAAVASTLYYIHTDHLNTPRLITNQVGQPVWRWDNNDPFGGNPPDENPSGLGAFIFDLGFPGQRRDRETGTFYNYFRDCYDPATGRYCQADPLGIVTTGQPTPTTSLNQLYAYASGNPLSNTDPYGLISPGQAVVIAGAIATIYSVVSTAEALYRAHASYRRCVEEKQKTLAECRKKEEEEVAKAIRNEPSDVTGAMAAQDRALRDLLSCTIDVGKAATEVFGRAFRWIPGLAR